MKLESYILCPGPEMTVFKEWWCSLDDDSTTSVKYPYERHGLAGLPSSHAKNEMMSDFLDFVDANSQPNGRHAASCSAQFIFLPKLTRLDSPRQGKRTMKKN